MLDFHSHILPEIDDGSRTVEESLNMLASLAEQGVTTVVATPHFYATRSDPDCFLRQRQKACERLMEQYTDRLPRLLLGAEVLYFDGMDQVQELTRLRIESTGLLLVEMPFSPWSSRSIQEIISINERDDITVVLAHVERYLAWQPAHVWEDLLQSGVLMQANTEFFLRWRSRNRALCMLRHEQIHFLGTDCHNMDSRPPNLAPAVELIRRKLGEAAVGRLSSIQHAYFGYSERG